MKKLIIISLLMATATAAFAWPVCPYGYPPSSMRHLIRKNKNAPKARSPAPLLNNAPRLSPA